MPLPKPVFVARTFFLISVIVISILITFNLLRAKRSLEPNASHRPGTYRKMAGEPINRQGHARREADHLFIAGLVGTMDWRSDLGTSEATRQRWRAPKCAPSTAGPYASAGTAPARVPPSPLNRPKAGDTSLRKSVGWKVVWNMAIETSRWKRTVRDMLRRCQYRNPTRIRLRQYED